MKPPGDTVTAPSAPAAASRYILGMRVDATSYESATRQILDWAREGRGRSVYCATVHMAMECFDDAALRHFVNTADMVTADGVPLVWALHRLGVPGAVRVYGPDLTRAVLAAAERAAVPVGFYGGAPAVLARLLAAVRRTHPLLGIRYAWAPPFRPLTDPEDQAIVAAIRDSGTRLLFVGLGCPRQERWVAEHRRRLGAVLLAVGAAFDFLSGAKPQAPACLQRAGCEWLFRLATEPRRLWKRYLKQNPRFLVLCGAQLWRARQGESR